MRTLLIHPVNFSLNQRLVLSSLLRLCENQFNHQWDLSMQESAADVTFLRLEVPSGLAEIGVVAGQSFIRVDSPFVKDLRPQHVLLPTLSVPLRAELLIELLNRLGAVAKIRLSVSQNLLDWTEPERLVEVLRPLAAIRFGSGLRIEVETGGGVDVHFDPSGGTWSISDSTEFAAFTQCVEAGRRVRLCRGSKTFQRDTKLRGPLKSLIWLLVVSRPAERLLSNLSESSLFSLVQWPDFGELRSDGSLIHLTALMMRGPLKLGQILSISEIDRGRTLAFLNACEHVGLLRQHSPQELSARVESPVKVRPAVASASAGEPRRLLVRLRVALGLAS